MTKEEILEAITDDKMMPFIQPDQLANIVDFVIKNFQPSLPSSLDEAAEEALDEDFDANWHIDEWGDGCTEPGYNQKQMLLMFKAGAEWMAGQGITFEGKASRRYENGLAGFVSWILFDQQKAAHLLVNQGEEADVIINIRKK